MSIRDLTREFRKNQTKAEQIFWKNVRNRKINGNRFLRQYPIRFDTEGVKCFFVADFFCAKAKLVVEIDGKIHDNQKEYDEYRTHIINNLGYRVVRFKNYEVLNNFPSVINKLKPISVTPLLRGKQERGWLE